MTKRDAMRAAVEALQTAHTGLDLAYDCVTGGRYDEALLHLGHHHAKAGIALSLLRSAMEEGEDAPEIQSPPEGGEGLEVQKGPRERSPCKQRHYDTLLNAMQRISDMDEKGLRADDLGRAANIAREALANLPAEKEHP